MLKYHPCENSEGQEVIACSRIRLQTTTLDNITNPRPFLNLTMSEERRNIALIQKRRVGPANTARVSAFASA